MSVPTRVLDQPAARRRVVQALARALGVQPSYRASDGHRLQCSDDALFKILSALGPTIERPSDAADALTSLIEERAGRTIDPVIVLRPGHSPVVDLSPPPELDLRDIWITIRLEDGTMERRRLADWSSRRAAAAPRRDRPVRRLRLRERLPPGYHWVDVEAPGVHETSLLLAAPGRCPRPDTGWGVFLPLHALRGEPDWGVGTYRQLGELGDRVRALGGSFTATLPFLATGRDDLSPYLPSSRMAWSDLYVDVEAVPELTNDDPWASRARELLAGHELRHRLAELSGRSRADVMAVSEVKRSVTELLARSLDASPSDRLARFERFRRERPEATAYARFCAASDRYGADWMAWPSPMSSGALPEDLEPELVRHYEYVQWLADDQVAEAARHGLYLDLPVGVHPSGFDTWQSPDAFAHDLSGGAPPDAFFADGQRWGFPPLHPEGIRRQRYRYVIDALRHSMRHASMVRIDHVMGLHRMFCIPEKADASDGAYVRYRHDELYAVVALEAMRSGTSVVGEDLGTVPHQVRRDMQRSGIQRSFVFQFESTPDDPIPRTASDAVASLGTHDLPPFAGFWHGTDIEDRHCRGLIDDTQAKAERRQRQRWTQAVSQALTGVGGSSLPVAQALTLCLGHLGACGAGNVLVDLEDLLLEEEPQNRPGTGLGAGNFTRRAAKPIDALDDPTVHDLLDGLRQARRPIGSNGGTP